MDACKTLRVLSVGALLALAFVQSLPGNETRLDSGWKLPSLAEAESRLSVWLATQPLDEKTRLAAIHEFSDQAAGGSDFLTALVKSLAVFDNRARELMVAAEPVPPQTSAGDVTWLESTEGTRFDVRHLRLFYARALIEAREYDEALQWMQDIKPSEVICPEILLFQRAIVHHQLVQADEALDAIEELMRCESPMPTRISRLTSMMQADLASLESDTLDHIGRRMRDVERRLQIGRANRQTTQVEESIIASLDKLIKEAEEEQQRQMQSQQSARSQPAPSGKAMEDSRIAELKGAGKVDPRRLGEETQWGNLPPHERERVVQQLGRDFPAYYREVVEEYFRRLASEKEKSTESP